MKSGRKSEVKIVGCTVVMAADPKQLVNNLHNVYPLCTAFYLLKHHWLKQKTFGKHVEPAQPTVITHLFFNSKKHMYTSTVALLAISL